MLSKKDLRIEMKNRLSSEGDADRAKKSIIIKDRVLAQDAYKKASVVSLFVGMTSEVNTKPLIEESIRLGKRVVTPLTNLKDKTLTHYEIKNLSTDLVVGTMGILEPNSGRLLKVNAEEIDLALVPGLLFDEKNYRVGYGAGLYDRFLKTLKPGTKKIGLGFSFQKVKELPVEPHDVRLDLVITD